MYSDKNECMIELRNRLEIEVDWTMDIETNEYNGDKILKYNGKFILIYNAILILCIIISLILIPVTDSLSIIFTFVFGVWLLVFFFIDMVNRISSQMMLKKYDTDELRKELSNTTTKKISGIETYLTDNYIISNSKKIRIVRYQDIVWTYIAEPYGRVAQKRMNRN